MRKRSGGEYNAELQQQIIQEIVSKLKTRQITPEQIGKATTDASTPTKNEARQVETGENAQEQKREGEEVGDGN